MQVSIHHNARKGSPRGVSTVKNWLIPVLILVLAFPAVGMSKVVMREDFNASANGDIPGEVVPSGGGNAWRTGTISTPPGVVGPMLSYPVAGLLSPSAGTLEFDLVREERFRFESIFSLVDAAGQPLLVAWIRWDKAVPEIVFDGSHEGHRLWVRDYDIPGVGAKDFEEERIVFNQAVARGQRFHLAFTWGPTPGECRIYLNGKPLTASVASPFGLPWIIENSTTLVLGAEPEIPGRPPTAYSYLNSPLADFRVSDAALTPDQFLLFPVIKSVSHNGFEVAGFSGKLVAGDTLTVTLEGEAGGVATFEVGDAKDLPMAEKAEAPGVYVGSYQIPWGVLAEDGPVVGRLVNNLGVTATPVTAAKAVQIDSRALLSVKPSNELVPADKRSRAGLTIVATDANGRKIKGHPLKLTLSTTNEYTGIVGSGNFDDEVGGRLEVDWGGVTDSFGEVSAQYLAGFAAKTVLISAKDMSTGDVGLGHIRSFIEGRVDIAVKNRNVRLLAERGSLEVTASRDWLTADGKSRSRITARVLDPDGRPLSGDQIRFSILEGRGSIKVLQSRTDGTGRAWADYIAGTTIGQVQIEVVDLTNGLSSVIAIELRADAPAEITLTADPPEVFIGDKQGTTIKAKVNDINGNPNWDTEVLFAVVGGDGGLSANKGVTDKREGVTEVTFVAGSKAGVATVRGTVTSRVPTEEELSVAEGAVFLYGLDKDPGVLTLKEWLVDPLAEVTEGQPLAVLEGRDGEIFGVKAPRTGTLSVRVAEEGDEVRVGDTLVYVVEPEETP